VFDWLANQASDAWDAAKGVFGEVLDVETDRYVAKRSYTDPLPGSNPFGEEATAPPVTAPAPFGISQNVLAIAALAGLALLIVKK